MSASHSSNPLTSPQLIIGGVLALGTVIATVIGHTFVQERGNDRTTRQNALRSAHKAYNAGDDFLKKQEYAKAGKEFKKAQELIKVYSGGKIAGLDKDSSSRYVTAMYQQALSLYFMCKYGVEIIPEAKSSTSLVNSLTSYFSSSKPTEETALSVIWNLLELDPTEDDALNLRGMIYLKFAIFDDRREYFKKAALTFQKAFELNEQSATEILWLFACAKSKEPAEKKSDLNPNVVKLDPLIEKDIYKMYRRIIHIKDEMRHNINFPPTPGFNTFELHMIYAIAYQACAKRKKSKELERASSYIKSALANINEAMSLMPCSSAMNPERAKLYSLTDEINQQLKAITHGNGTITLESAPSAPELKVSEVTAYFDQYSSKAKKVGDIKKKMVDESKIMEEELNKQNLSPSTQATTVHKP